MEWRTVSMTSPVRIVLGEGTDVIRFGATRGEVSHSMKCTPQRVRFSEFDLSDIDLFEEYGISVYYDEQDRCEAIEFSRIAKVVLDDYDLFAHSAREVQSWMILKY